jgi:acylpyruvate hydrolase
MKLISYTQHGKVLYGVLTESGVVDMRQLLPSAPISINDYVALPAHEPHAALARRAAGMAATPLSEVMLLPCVPAPGKIICLGINYHDHATEGGNPVADYPAFFLRCSTSLLAHEAAIEMSAISTALDYEAELALVVGQASRNMSEAQALQSVFAYACFNDATYRDYQRKTTQWTIGKNFDKTGGFGPYLVTVDELPEGCKGLHIESRLNGLVMQSANTDSMIFPVAQTLSLLSQCMTLNPGDVVVMGTPAGVGYARKPPVWMGPGDVIEIEIEGIGILRNPVGMR